MGPEGEISMAADPARRNAVCGASPDHLTVAGARLLRRCVALAQAGSDGPGRKTPFRFLLHVIVLSHVPAPRPVRRALGDVDRRQVDQLAQRGDA